MFSRALAAAHSVHSLAALELWKAGLVDIGDQHSILLGIDCTAMAVPVIGIHRLPVPHTGLGQHHLQQAAPRSTA